MSKGLEAFNNILGEGDFRYFSSLYDIDMFKEDINSVNKELKALEIIKKYIVINRVFKDLINKEAPNLRLIEIKALIPDDEYKIIEEVLK